MDIKELKESIEAGTIGTQFLILQYEDVPFVADQYLREISKLRGRPIEYVEDIVAISNSSFDIFGMASLDDSIRVYRTTELSYLPDNLKTEENLYIIVKKITDKNALTVYQDSIVNIPPLEGWHLQDYMYSVAEGVDRKSLDWLIKATNNDIYRLENELDKFRLFTPSEQKFLFNDMLHEGAYSDLSSFNVFNITNAITSREMNNLKLALKEIKSFDAEPLGIVVLLYQGFRKLIQVWLALKATPENTGLKSGMIYAINKQPKVFNKEQLLKSFLLLTDIDRQLRSGNIDTKWLVDYLVCRILTY